MAGEVGFTALFEARHADEVRVGIAQLQQIVGGLPVHEGGEAVEAVAQVRHVRGHLLAEVADDMAGRVLVGIDAAAGHLRLHADELALEHVELRHHTEVHVVGHDHALIGVPAVQHRVLADGHDLPGLVVGHVVGDLPALPEDEIGPLRGDIRVGEAAGLHEVLFAGSDGRLAGDAEVVAVGAVVVEADVEVLLDSAAPRLDDLDSLHEGMGVAGGLHGAGLVRVPVELYVVGGLIVGEDGAVPIGDGAPGAGLVGGDHAGGTDRRLVAFRLLHGQLHQAPAEVAAHGEEHQGDEQEPGIQFPYGLTGHTASTCRFNKGLKTAMNSSAQRPVSRARGNAP